MARGVFWTGIDDHFSGCGYYAPKIDKKYSEDQVRRNKERAERQRKRKSEKEVKPDS